MKTAVPFAGHRGFKSHPRRYSCAISAASVASTDAESAIATAIWYRDLVPEPPHKRRFEPFGLVAEALPSKIDVAARRRVGRVTGT